MDAIVRIGTDKGSQDNQPRRIGMKESRGNGGARKMVLFKKKKNLRGGGTDGFNLKQAVPVMEPGGCRTHNGAHFVGYIPNQNGGIRDCSPRKEQKQMETVQTYVPGASLTSRRGEVVRKVEWERR
jgi:hypothetical protein